MTDWVHLQSQEKTITLTQVQMSVKLLLVLRLGYLNTAVLWSRGNPVRRGLTVRSCTKVLLLQCISHCSCKGLVLQAKDWKTAIRIKHDSLSTVIDTFACSEGVHINLLYSTVYLNIVCSFKFNNPYYSGALNHWGQLYVPLQRYTRGCCCWLLLWCNSSLLVRTPGRVAPSYKVSNVDQNNSFLG